MSKTNNNTAEGGMELELQEQETDKNEKVSESNKKTSSVAKEKKKRAFDPNDIVTVRNGFQGTLVYRSRKTGESFVWDEFGAEQDMELNELRNAKSSGKKYFINNWFMFDDPEILEYLGMSRYYKTSLNIDDFDDLFTLPADEVSAVIAKLPDGQKQSVAYRAKQLMAEDKIDSNKVIAALEQSLGVSLVDR